MTRGEYEEITGLSVPDSRANFMAAQIQRSQTILEDLLGFTLDPDGAKENLYTEAGISQTDWAWDCFSPDTNLLPADPVIGAYRVFDFNQLDKFHQVDPFITAYAVKLIHGDVTVHEFTNYTISQGSRGIKKYLKLTEGLYPNLWGGAYYNPPRIWPRYCEHLQLAVDADWLTTDSNVPWELQQVLASMATFYGNPKRLIKSESIGAHSYSLTDQNAPEEDKAPNLKIIQRWAGPAGRANQAVTL